jgi:hypothetical protein
MSIQLADGARRMRARLALLIVSGMLLLLATACSGLGIEPRAAAAAPFQDATATAPPPAATEEAAQTAPPATEDAAPAGTAEATAGPVETTGTVRVSVSNGTPGGNAPAELPIKLFVVEAEGAQTTFEGVTGADGTVTFADVPIRNDRFYVATTVFNERAFGSDMTRGTPDTPAMELPVTVYEFTSDPAALKIDSLQFRVLGQPGSLQVAQVMRVTNTSDRMFSAGEMTADERYPSVVLHMPAGAQLMGTSEDEAQFIMGDDGSVTDTRPVLPGEQRILHVIYSLPYQPLGTPLEVPLDYALDGRVDVTVSPISVDAGVRVAGQSVPALAMQSGEDADQRVFGGELSAPAGATFQLELRGEIVAPSGAAGPAASDASNASAPAPAGISRDLLVGVLIGAGLGLVVLGGFFLVKDRLAWRNSIRAAEAEAESVQETPPDTVETLVAALAALDDEYARGEITKDSYEARRDELKKELARRMRG